ncbi:type II secretion system F family protein [Streptomyces sp. F63]|uniref:type II secretion system F family protein n=1 Tax=Streptomyces sp. F63 TaxID=2824887 RepID=UPI001B374F91|nr:type II secretion system F family protein [Streptomyces sp. F63]MBQ0985407.1 type II secretion system F family protein [Streptomyces sp. F63]
MNTEFVHSLWAAVLAGGAVFAAAVLRNARSRASRRRLALLLTPVRDPHRDGTVLHRRPGRDASRPGRRCSGRVRRARWAGAVREWWPAVGAALAAVAVIGGAAGCAVGPAAGYAVRRWVRGRPGRRSRQSTDTAGLPQAADLLAACLAAGAGPREAALAVGQSLTGPVGERLVRVAAELRLGGDPEDAWGRLAELPGTAGLARCLARAQLTGVSAVEPVTRVAAECRAGRARAAAASARRAAVLATAPLGLCFLPAFLTVGVAPVLIGLANQLLSGAR